MEFQVNVDSRLIKDIDSSVALSSVTDVSSGSIGEAYLINFHDAYKTPWSLGCVCCSSVKDLSTALGKLMSANPLVDQIIVECSGLANVRWSKNFLSLYLTNSVNMAASKYCGLDRRERQPTKWRCETGALGLNRILI